MITEIFGYEVEIDETRVTAPKEAIREQVVEYAAGERREFDFDVSFPDGFVGDVMRAMYAIPYGERRTYGELAAELDTAAVAVGQGCGSNPIPLLVPCHRVVGADSLGGFSAGGERGVELKRELLALEGQQVDE